MDWYDVLLAARAIGLEEVDSKGKKVRVIPFTAPQLAVEADIKPGKRSRAVDIAAGWISKFVRWGYLLRDGARRPAAGGRSTQFYRLTDWGVLFERRRKLASKKKKGGKS